MSERSSALAAGVKAPAVYDYSALAVELLRALRGKRSRPGFSRRLGYRSNVAQRWESGASFPTATSFFAACDSLKIDLRAGLITFLRHEPAWLANSAHATQTGVSLLLSELRGKTPIATLATRLGKNRFTVSRWLNGDANPKLPELLALIEAMSRRLIDFIEILVDPSRLPSMSASWKRLVLMRKTAYELPLSHAALRALELAKPRRKTTQHVAQKIGIQLTEAKQLLDVLAASGQVTRGQGGWRTCDAGAVVDTGGDRQHARALRLSWIRLALERLQTGTAGHCGYSVFAVSTRDLERMNEVHLAYVRQMQSIIADSTAPDCVGLYCSQLLDMQKSLD